MAKRIRRTIVSGIVHHRFHESFALARQQKAPAAKLGRGGRNGIASPSGYFLPADFLADLAFFFPDFLAGCVALAAGFFFAAFFLSPKTFSQFFQNPGVVPVRTIGPPIPSSPKALSIQNVSRLESEPL
jgi:hypothetical protein